MANNTTPTRTTTTVTISFAPLNVLWPWLLVADTGLGDAAATEFRRKNDVEEPFVYLALYKFEEVAWIVQPDAALYEYPPHVQFRRHRSLQLLSVSLL